MRTLILVVGALLIVLGGVWFLQGIGVLPGSFMTGQLRWAQYGSIAIFVGLLLIVFGRRRESLLEMLIDQRMSFAALRRADGE